MEDDFDEEETCGIENDVNELQESGGDDMEELELEELQTGREHGQDKLAVRIALMCPGPLRTWLLAGGPTMTELKLSFFAGMGAALVAATMATGIALVIIYAPGSVATVHPDHTADDVDTYSNGTLATAVEYSTGLS